MITIGQTIRRGIVRLVLPAGSIGSVLAVEEAGGSKTNVTKESFGRFLNDLPPSGPVVIDKRLDREGRVDLGTLAVVEELDPPVAPGPSRRR